MSMDSEKEEGPSPDHIVDEVVTKLKDLSDNRYTTEQTNGESNDVVASSNTIRRRSFSTATVKTVLSMKDLESIPPPILESIPNTPGFDSRDNIFETSFDTQGTKEDPILSIPRPILSRSNTGLGSTVQLLTVHSIDNNNNTNPSSSFFYATNDNNNNNVDDNELDDKNIQNKREKMTIRNPPLNLYRLVCCCLWCLTLGMCDGVLGAILPMIEEYCNVSYSVVSLIWLGNALGFITIAFIAHKVDEILGRYKMSIMSCVGILIMLGIITSGCRYFAVIVVGFYFSGVGAAMGLSQFNIFLSKFDKGNTYLGWFHGSYGVGAFLSPLIATVMVQKGGIRWNYYYFIPLTLCASNALFTALSFRGCETDLAQWEQDDDEFEKNIEMTKFSRTNEVEETTVVDSHPIEKEKHDFKTALKDYRTWLLCVFIFFYQGAEVALGGWVVTFLLNNRDVNPATVGYVASGFWGGLTLGRFTLAPTLPVFGVRRSSIVLMILIMAFTLITWLVPNIYVAGIAFSLTGVCIGPIYPMMVMLMTRILPRKIRFCSLTLGTAFGSSGGSAIPFAVGMASQFVGTYILFPIVLISVFFVFASWLGQPNIERKGAIKTIWQKIW